MNKIPTLYRRDPDDLKRVLDEVNPECKWVLDGEGIATRKYDGTCVMLDEDGAWWARREVKPGKTPPAGWVEVDHDEVTGKRVGWEPIAQSPFAKFHAEALGNFPQDRLGTYELCGPKVNGNPEGFDCHLLVKHEDAEEIPGEVVDPMGLLLTARMNNWEGIVWHHEDGRMAKLKVRDLGTQVGEAAGAALLMAGQGQPAIEGQEAASDDGVASPLARPNGSSMTG